MNLTAILDKIRISLGDSKCPMKIKCENYSAKSICCVYARGRLEDGRRAPCYYLASLLGLERLGETRC